MYIILLRKLSFVDRISREKREIIIQSVHKERGEGERKRNSLNETILLSNNDCIRSYLKQAELCRIKSSR